MKQLTDNEYWHVTWANFKKGDREAFKVMYNEFIDTLYAYGSKITKDKSLLEDSIQDVFIDVYKYGKGLRKPESLEYYLFKTLKRIILRKLKENSKFDIYERFPDFFELKFPIENMDKEQLEGQLSKLQNEMQGLDQKKRELVFLKFNSGLSYVEIGELLDIKPDTAKKQIYRILKYLRGKIGNKIISLFLTCSRT